MIIPLLNKVKETLKILSKKENEIYRNKFFEYLEYQASYYINNLTRNYTDQKVNQLIEVIAGQIAHNKFEKLKEIENY